MKKIAQTKIPLVVIIFLVALLWWFAIPSGSVIGNALAGLIMGVAIAALWIAK